uniref:Multidrug/Oligosaccharidyllipid/Polysaccharide (MOP) Flippase Superfamily putative n=1 Tax=Albugo laibachii Nc14 TaxID=890382 RepID=F0WSM6_9STRA|nr:Multidrug/Oligosaccharidyllipid/Polysaccharide (MOP) Flippase Superfamily putative [Albugo laibachii Nc14]|eukprot:CCA24352.1 Multidrug/Oligosaccharidyllipid/Polysaccharide (MOP) Flippase Superfamily putative [Albugo laibachii Nc14]
MSNDASERTALQQFSNETDTLTDENDQIEKACLEYEGVNSPLIGRHSSSSFSLLYDVEKSLYEREDLETTPNWNHEFRKLISLFYPVMSTYILEYLPGVTVVILVGHLDSPYTKYYVDAATLSSMFTNISSLSIGFGLTSGLDTLCSQAYGANRVQKMGIYFQSALLVVGSCLLPIFILNWYAGYFLKLVGQNEQVAEYSGNFSRITVIGIPFLFLYEMFRKVLQSQHLVRPLVIIAIIGNIVNIGLGYILTYHTSLGFYGAAVSRVLGYITMPICMTPLFLWNEKYRQWWSGWDLRQAIKRAPLFLRLGVPGFLMMAMEWWAYEILALMSGLLPNEVVAVSVQTVLMNVASFTFMLYLGVGVSANVRVGNALGAGMPQLAKLVARISLYSILVLGCVMGALCVLFRNYIPLILINDRESVSEASNALLVFVWYAVMDGLNCVIQGIYRGAGRQNIAAKVNAVSYYLIGLPIAALLAFKANLGVSGLWIGFGIGMSVAFVSCSWMLARADWRRLSVEAGVRIAVH